MAELAFHTIEKIETTSGEATRVYFKVDGAITEMKVSAACFSNNTQVGLFVWCEPVTNPDRIYPLAEWQSCFKALEFDICVPVAQLKEKYGLSNMTFSLFEGIPEDDQRFLKHPLAAAVNRDIGGIQTPTKRYYPVAGLSHFSRLNSIGYLKGESYRGYAKLLERLSRIEESGLDPTANAFLFACQEIGEYRSFPLKYIYGSSFAIW